MVQEAKFEDHVCLLVSVLYGCRDNIRVRLYTYRDASILGPMEQMYV